MGKIGWSIQLHRKDARTPIQTETIKYLRLSQIGIPLLSHVYSSAKLQMCLA